MKRTQVVKAYLCGLGLNLLIASCMGEVTHSPAKPLQSHPLSFEVIAQYPHDTKTFTQGLEVYGTNLIESSGLYRRSFLRVYEPQTQKIQKQTNLPGRFFAEGLTRVGDKLYLLTWRAGKALVYDLPSLEHVNTFEYKGQGWGLCHDGEQLFMSNGSHHLTIRDPQNFSVKKQLTVTHKGSTVSRLNELECAEGYVWANQWMSTTIFQIHPETGQVLNSLDLSKLVPFQLRKSREAVLNGIAYDSEKKAYWVTGKYWNALFLIKIAQ